MVVRLFGVTTTGNSICVNVQKYRPYFYASAPEGFGPEHIDRTKATLNENMKVILKFCFYKKKNFFRDLLEK